MVPINGPMLPDLVNMQHNPGVVKPLGIPIPQFLAFEQDDQCCLYNIECHSIN